MLSLTNEQIEILNNLQKYDPSWRGFATSGQDFGDILESTQEDVVAIESTVTTLEDTVDAIAVETGGTLSADLVFNSAAEIVLGSVPLGRKVTISVINVTTGFNGTLPTLTIGTNTNPTLIMAEDDSAIDEVVAFLSTPISVFTETTELKAFLNSGSSTQGECNITVSFS